MRIGTPKEIKDHEYRVGLTPTGARALTQAGHEVLIETDAGLKVGFPDAAYAASGARVVSSAAEVYGAEIIVKVKELQSSEFGLTHYGQILYGYHHFAPAPELTREMLTRGLSCLAYETVTDNRGGLPLLAPMSRIAGRLAPQVGAWALEMANGGSGVLLGGVPGVPPAHVVVIGAGSVGSSAIQIASGMGARITVLDIDSYKLAALDEQYRGRIETCASTAATLADKIGEADLLIGALLVPGKRAPQLVTRAHLQSMRPGSVLVDVAIDQGGVAETSRPTTHSEPIFLEEGVVHYCVANMPAAVARTATLALTQATLPHLLALAKLGLDGALAQDPNLAVGLQIHKGRITHAGLKKDIEAGASSG
jgi:alanine dehydrogenase